MTTTFQNSAQVLSMGLFFTIITIGLAASLPAHLYSGLVSNGVPAAQAHQVAGEPPIGALFAAFLATTPSSSWCPTPCSSISAPPNSRRSPDGPSSRG